MPEQDNGMATYDQAQTTAWQKAVAHYDATGHRRFHQEDAGQWHCRDCGLCVADEHHAPTK